VQAVLIKVYKVARAVCLPFRSVCYLNLTSVVIQEDIL